MRLRLLACLILSGLPVAARAQANRYSVTAAEKLACMSDAERFCMSAYPSEERLLGCMKANRASLSDDCGQVFDAGMKRRGLR